MADDPDIPAHLIALQQAFDAAQAAVDRLVSDQEALDGPWSEEARAELSRLREQRLATLHVLYDARVDAGFETVPRQQLLRDAARQE